MRISTSKSEVMVLSWKRVLTLGPEGSPAPGAVVQVSQGLVHK